LLALIVSDGCEHRRFRVRYPRGDDFGGFVAQPSHQNRRIVPVIRNAQLRYSAPWHLAGRRRVLGDSIPDFHFSTMPPNPSSGKALDLPWRDFRDGSFSTVALDRI
jgi:hypothetical protein